ncbi:HAMP domain-containing histidine kinase [Pleurocapsales cyanobacterium LEGE 10410]|nr:HAMP domain-containing histidine kinase [Pleurocapsales cyanobacterium LEGE 10410]
MALMFLFVTIAIPVIRQRLFAKVDARVREDMEEEIEDFEELLLESLLESATEQNTNAENNLDQNQKIYQAFDHFIDNRVPEDDNFLIAIVDGQFYKSSSRFLPEAMALDSDLMNRWQNLTEEEQEEEIIPNEAVGSIVYQAVPIETPAQTLGVFVIAHTTAGERAEIVESVNVIIRVLILILAISLVLAWFTTGKILAPLKQLSDVVQSISESDLTQRIKIKGTGELAELGNTFNQMMDRIENSFIAQRNFVNDAGHELRTPITIVRGHLELMEDDPQEQQETIELVTDELDRMSRLVEDLILLVKAEGLDFLHPETIDLTIFTEELLIKIKALGNRHWHLDHLARGKMIGDRQRLTQAIVNLANNAVQHTNPGDVIALGSKLEGGRVKFSIRDTGEGIPEEEHQRIFARFARVKNAPRRSEGSGLGLSIVKAIVEAHWGEIELQSNLGTGSTFTLVFPLELNRQLVVEEKYNKQ